MAQDFLVDWLPINADLGSLIGFVSAFTPSNLTGITAMVIRHNTAAQGYYFSTCPDITSIVFQNLTSIGPNAQMQIWFNAALVVLRFPVFVPANGQSFNFSQNALDAASVNGFLARCVANPAYASGNVDLSGGTNSPPTGQGIVDRTTLLARSPGVNVLTN